MNSTIDVIDWTRNFSRRSGLMRRSAVREALKLTRDSEIVSFAGGLPAAELFPMEFVAQATQQVFKSTGGACLQYSETEGLRPLREWLAKRYSTRRRQWTADNFIITTGGQQALDLLGRVFLDEGDRVLVENPTYLALLASWRPLETEFVPVPCDDEGMDISMINRSQAQDAKLLYTIPNFQNPQGTTQTLERRRAILDYCTEESVLLIEDDPYGQLRYNGKAQPHLIDLESESPSFDSSVPGGVVYVGTFSKILMPGLRVGFALGPAEVIDKLVEAKQAADLHTSTLNQWLALELCQLGFLEEFIPILCAEYRARRDTMLAALDKHLPESFSWTHPEGGMFLWLRLPETMDAAALLPVALRNKVAFVPGQEFHSDGAGKNTIRLNFSSASPERIETGIERLAQALLGAK